MKFDENVLALWLLNSLRDSWEMFRASLNNAAPKGGLTMKYVKSGILKLRRMYGTISYSEALVAKIRGSKNRNDDRNNKGLNIKI